MYSMRKIMCSWNSEACKSMLLHHKNKITNHEIEHSRTLLTVGHILLYNLLLSHELGRSRVWLTPSILPGSVPFSCCLPPVPLPLLWLGAAYTLPDVQQDTAEPRGLGQWQWGRGRLSVPLMSLAPQWSGHVGGLWGARQQGLWPSESRCWLISFWRKRWGVKEQLLQVDRPWRSLCQSTFCWDFKGWISNICILSRIYFSTKKKNDTFYHHDVGIKMI